MREIIIFLSLMAIVTEGRHADFENSPLHSSPLRACYKKIGYPTVLTHMVNTHAEFSIRCQEDICGSNEENLTVGDIHRRANRMKEEISLPESLLNILDRISAYHEGKREKILVKLARLKEFFKGGNFTINQRRYFIAEVFEFIFFKSIDYKNIVDNHETLLTTLELLDEESIRKELLPYINPKIIPFMLSMTERKVNHQQLKKAAYRLRHGSMDFFSWENPNKSIQEIIDQEAKRAKGKIQEIATMLGFSFNSAEIINVDSPPSVQISTEGQMENFFDSVIYLNVLLELLLDEELYDGFNWISTYDQFYNTQAMTNKIDEIRKEIKGIDLPQKLLNCGDIIKNNYLALPNGEELEAFKARAERIKISAKELIETTFSTETTPLVTRFFDNVTIKYPSTSENILENIEREMEFILRGEERRGRSTVAEDIIDILHWESVEDSFFKMCSHLEEIFEIDTKFLDDGIAFTGDVQYMSDGVIKVSWQSVKNPEYGEAVLAHELGHHLENFFENNRASITSLRKFQRVRYCLSKMQKETRYNFLEEKKILRRSDPVTYPVSQFAQEDFADLFSFLIPGKPRPNLGCFLINDVGGYWENHVFYPYEADQNDDLVRYRGPEEENQEIIRHSTDFFRMLHFEFLKKGHLPSSCQRFLSEEDIPFYPEDCGRYFSL